MALFHQLDLQLEGYSYPIYIGDELFSDQHLFSKHIRSSEVMVVTNESVAGFYLSQLKSVLIGYKVDVVFLPEGEEQKTLANLDLVFTSLLQNGHTRQTTLVALGGGVIGDMTGFAAACYQRGVSFLQIPTTLLSQVDASVGGKTAVNHPLGKNMIGAFHQPEAVFIDIKALQSLPRRELIAGMAEVIKHAMLADSALFDWLEANMTELLEDPASEKMAYAIQRNCEIKANIVTQDEREQGVRALLNLGHTFAHAIETREGYGAWVHGEAVGAGLVMAADLSVRLKMLDKVDAVRVKCLVEQAGLPTKPPGSMNSDEFLSLMKRDKKATSGGIRFVLLEGLGRASVRDNVGTEELSQTLEAADQLCIYS